MTLYGSGPIAVGASLRGRPLTANETGNERPRRDAPTAITPKVVAVEGRGNGDDIKRGF